MTNADKFKHLFGIYATELWAMPEKDFLKWLNSEVVNCSEIPNNSDTISRQAALEAFGLSEKTRKYDGDHSGYDTRMLYEIQDVLEDLPPAEPKTGKWILDRSGAYCCSECMEPCAGYVMMKPRDKYCKMCGAKMEVTT